MSYLSKFTAGRRRLALLAALAGVTMGGGLAWQAAPAALAQAEEGMVYVVRPGDTLWAIAETYLGDGHRFGEIIAATRARRAEDATFADLSGGSLLAGDKLWIPPADATASPVTPAPPAAPAPAPVSPIQAGGSPGGQIAFSFWNRATDRCTYEINVIDVAACLAGPEQCQANRRILPLNNVSEPALAPDGRQLAFRGWGEFQDEDSPFLECADPIPFRALVTAALDGTAPQAVTQYWEDSHPDWSPDGRRILFDTARIGDGVTRVMVVDAGGGEAQELRIAGEQPAWAPDNDRFVYRGCDLTGNRCGLWQARAVEARAWETGFNMIGPVIEEAEAAHPDWSPLDERIVFQSPRSGSWDLYLVEADGSNRRQLTADPAIEGLPAWSPDGQWIAYLSDKGGNWGLWIMRADGSGQQLLFPYDGGVYNLPVAAEPYGQRDWLSEQISWGE